MEVGGGRVEGQLRENRALERPFLTTDESQEPTYQSLAGFIRKRRQPFMKMDRRKRERVGKSVRHDETRTSPAFFAFLLPPALLPLPQSSKKVSNDIRKPKNHKTLEPNPKQPHLPLPPVSSSHPHSLLLLPLQTSTSPTSAAHSPPLLQLY